MKSIHIVAFILLIVGGLNWLLVGVFQYDLVASLFGQASVVSRIVYALVGVSAVYELFTHKSSCKACESSSKTA